MRSSQTLSLMGNQMSELERKVEEHTVQIQELKDEVDFKKWKIDSLIEKIDNLTNVVQQIQLNQMRDDNDIKNRVTSIESTISTLRWVVGVGLTALGVLVAYLGFFVSHL